MGEICDSFEYGLNAAATDYDGENKYIRITDIDDNSHEFLQNNVTSPDIDFSGAENYKLKQGDILFARTGASVGKTYIYEESDGLVYYAGFLIRGRVKYEYSPEFVFQNTLTADYERFIRITSQRSGQPGVNAQEYASYQIATPVLEEQQQIGAYFSTLDHLITLHQRKYFIIYNKLITWEQRKLIDVCDYVDYRGKTPTKTDSGVFLVTAKNVKDGYIDYGVSQEYISEDDYEEVMHRGKPEIGDVLITTEAPCGNVAQVNRADIALAQRIIKYRGQSNIVDNTYLKDYLQSPEFQNILNAKSSGGTVKGIKGSILHQQEIKYPKYEEQFKIGSYFNNLDNLITLHRRAL